MMKYVIMLFLHASIDFIPLQNILTELLRKISEQASLVDTDVKTLTVDSKGFDSVVL